MAWSPTPEAPTRTPRPGWFPETPTPSARTPQPAWFPIYTSTLEGELAALEAAFVGEIQQHGDLAATLRHALFAGTGQHVQSGDLDALLRPASFLGTNVTLGAIDSQLRPATAALTGGQAQAGTMAATLHPLDAAGSAQQVYTGTLGAALRQVAAQLVGTQGIPGTIAAELDALTANVTGHQTQTGAIAAVLRRALFTGTGSQQMTGTLAAALRNAITAMTGTVKKLVQYDNASNGGTGGTTTRSWTHNLDGNAIVVAFTHTNNANPVCTLGGVNIPRVYGPQAGGTYLIYTSRISIFAVVDNALPQGNQTISVTQAATASAAAAISFRGAGSLGPILGNTSSGNVNMSPPTGEGRAAVSAHVATSAFGTMSPNQVVNNNFVAFNTWATVAGYGLDDGSGITFTASHSGAKAGAVVPILPP